MTVCAESVAGQESQALPRRTVVLAILALSLGGFGIGITEFVAMGLLPNIA